MPPIVDDYKEIADRMKLLKPVVEAKKVEQPIKEDEGEMPFYCCFICGC